MIQYNNNNWFNDHGVCGSYNITKKVQLTVIFEKF